MNYTYCVRTNMSQKDVLLSQYAKKHVFYVALFVKIINLACGHQKSACSV